jgi:hypothetical protein
LLVISALYACRAGTANGRISTALKREACPELRASIWKRRRTFGRNVIAVSNGLRGCGPGVNDRSGGIELNGQGT